MILTGRTTKEWIFQKRYTPYCSLHHGKLQCHDRDISPDRFLFQQGFNHHLTLQSVCHTDTRIFRPTHRDIVRHNRLLDTDRFRADTDRLIFYSNIGRYHRFSFILLFFQFSCNDADTSRTYLLLPPDPYGTETGRYMEIKGAMKRRITDNPVTRTAPFSQLRLHASKTGTQLNRRRVLALSLSLIVLFFAVDAFYWHVKRSDQRNLEITFIDVGQGNSALLRFPGGKVMLVDCGRTSTTGVSTWGNTWLRRTCGAGRYTRWILWYSHTPTRIISAAFPI